MKKRKVNALLAIGLFLTMMVGIAGCGKERQLAAEIDPDTPVSEVQFPLKETAELSFITSAPATSTQEPNERVIFQRMEEQTNVHIDWTCFVSDQFSDKKNLALAQFGNLPDGLFNAGMSEYDLLRYAKQGKKPFRQSEISRILTKNGWIILDLRFRQQQMNWNRY